MDLELRKMLLRQFDAMHINEFKVTGTFIQNHANPRYYSGKLYQEGDIILGAMLLKEGNDREYIRLAYTEIDYYASNYSICEFNCDAPSYYTPVITPTKKIYGPRNQKNATTTTPKQEET